MLTHPHILIDLAISWLEDRGYRVYAGIVFEYYRRTQGLKELDRDMIIFLLGVETLRDSKCLLFSDMGLLATEPPSNLCR